MSESESQTSESVGKKEIVKKPWPKHRYGVIGLLVVLFVWAILPEYHKLPALEFVLGYDIDAKSTFIQAVVAAILVWVTYQSIDRADRQIEIAQETIDNSIKQLLLSKQQIDGAERDSLAKETPRLVVSQSTNEFGQYYYRIINMSFYLIYIEDIYLIKGNRKKSLKIEDRALKSGDNYRFELIESGTAKILRMKYGKPADKLEENKGSKDLPHDSMVIEYRYGFGDGKVRRQSYKFELFWLPNKKNLRHWELRDKLMIENN